MAQELQRHPRSGARDAQDNKALVEALTAALAQNAHTQDQQADQPSEEASIDLVELFFYVLSKIHFVIIAAVLGTLLAYLYVHFCYEPVYQSTAKLHIQNASGISVSVNDMTVASRLTPDYQEVFKTWEVGEWVKADMLERTAAWGGTSSLFAPYSDSEFGLHSLTVSNPENTRILYITVRHPRGEVAIEMANAYAEQAVKFIMERMGNAYEPTEFSAARDAQPVGMSRIRYLIMGFVLGTVLVLVALVMMFLLDDRPHTPDDITKMAGIPTLAVVPREQNVTRSKRRVQKSRKEGKK